MPTRSEGRVLRRLGWLLLLLLLTGVACGKGGDSGGGDDGRLGQWQVASFDDFDQEDFLVIVVNEREVDLS